MQRFSVIIEDPPWVFKDKLSMASGNRGAAGRYPLLEDNIITQLPIEELAEPNALLGIWCPSALFMQGMLMMANWGFEHKQIWTWVKTKKHPTGEFDASALAFGMGRLTRNCTEHLLVGTRGNMLQYLQNKSVRNCFPHPVLEHSKKPEIIQDALDSMFPDAARIELFARRQRPGWTCVGNEAPDTYGEDIFDSLARLLV